MTNENYTVKRFYEDGRKPRIQKRNLTLEQAQAWCSREDTSSKTHPKKKNGVTCEWFDGYTDR